MVPEAGDPQSWNRYSFVRNNPFNRIDPTGREDILQRFLSENLDVGATLSGAAARAVGGHEASASFFGSFGLSVIPGVGEFGDLGTLFSLDHNVGTGVRLLAAGSLVLSVATLGTSPNVGGSADELFEAGQELAESAITRSATRGLDELSAAAAAPSKNGRTVAGRALEKKTGGGRRGESAFEKPSGNAAEINQQAQDVVDDILTDPGSTQTIKNTGRFGEVTDVVAPDGRGVRFRNDDGSFVGLLEP